MADLFGALVMSVTNPSYHTCHSEHYIELDQENKPIVEVLKTDEERNTCNHNVSDDLHNENECKDSAPNLMLPVIPSPDWPKQESARIQNDGQRQQKNVSDDVWHTFEVA
jgi:hypothetical protein